MPTATAQLEYDLTAGAVDRPLDLNNLLHRVARGSEGAFVAICDGYTYAQVADLLQVKPAAIKTRMRDGIVRLRDNLGVEV